MRKLIFIIIILFSYCQSWAASPRLLFTDIVSGADVGLGDGKGSGAIVTVWGQNLGTPTITNGNPPANYDVYFTDSLSQKRSAAYIYYWCNADGGTSGGGPADNYSYKKAQEIAFSIPDSETGLGSITVKVNGVETSGLPFTVNTGSILWIKPTGNDSTGNGDWDTPWLTFYNGAAANSLSAGTIVYAMGTSESSTILIYYGNGTSAAHTAFVCYPGSTCATGRIHTFNGGAYSPYWTISKLSITTATDGIDVMTEGRLIGNEITDAGGETPETDCAGGQGGAFTSGKPDGTKMLGNYIHDFGCQATTGYHHTTYFTTRYFYATGLLKPVEFGWNYLDGNEARMGIHFYDEHGSGCECNGFDTSSNHVLVHDNVIKDQVGPVFDYANGGCSGYDTDGVFDNYNNLVINGGLEGSANSAQHVVQIGGAFNSSGSINFYNNTFYKYGFVDPSPPPEDVGGIACFSYLVNFGTFTGQWEFINNIVYDTSGRPYINTYNHQAPDVGNHNLWYSSDGSPPTLPSWKSNYQNADPLFTNIVGNDFSLQSGSPARSNGYDTSSIVSYDLLGVARPQNGVVDIGAFEYETSSSTTPELVGGKIANGVVK